MANASFPFFVAVMARAMKPAVAVDQAEAACAAAAKRDAADDAGDAGDGVE